MIRWLLVAVSLLGAAACSDSSGPSSASIAGKWHISGRDIRLPNDPTKCTLEADIEITEFAHEIDGSWSNGDFECGANLEGDPLGGYIDGSVDGSAFAILFDTYFFSFGGSWNGSRMSGTMHLFIPFTNERMEGTFTGERR